MYNTKEVIPFILSAALMITVGTFKLESSLNSVRASNTVESEYSFSRLVKLKMGKAINSTVCAVYSSDDLNCKNR